MISSGECREARRLLHMSREELAELAGLSEVTVAYFEGGRGRPKRSTEEAIRRALEKAGVLFVRQTGEESGVRLNKRKGAMLAVANILAIEQ